MRNVKQLRKMQKQNGFSLLELMIGLGIAAALIGVIILVYTQVIAGSNNYKSTQNLLSISTAVKTLYPSPNYVGLDASVIAKSKKIPEAYVSGTNIVNPFGQNVTIAPVNIGTGTNNGVAITYPGVPTNECNSLAAAVQANFVKIEVGTTAVKDDTAATPVSFSVPTVATECAKSNSSTIKFTST